MKRQPRAMQTPDRGGPTGLDVFLPHRARACSGPSAPGVAGEPDDGRGAHLPGGGAVARDRMRHAGGPGGGALARAAGQHRGPRAPGKRGGPAQPAPEGVPRRGGPHPCGTSWRTSPPTTARASAGSRPTARSGVWRAGISASRTKPAATRCRSDAAGRRGARLCTNVPGARRPCAGRARSTRAGTGWRAANAAGGSQADGSTGGSNS